MKAAVAGGARSLEDLEAACGAGAECGGCHPFLAELLGSEDRELIGASVADLSAGVGGHAGRGHARPRRS